MNERRLWVTLDLLHALKKAAMRSGDTETVNAVNDELDYRIAWAQAVQSALPVQRDSLERIADALELLAFEQCRDPGFCERH